MNLIINGMQLGLMIFAAYAVFTILCGGLAGILKGLSKEDKKDESEETKE